MSDYEEAIKENFATILKLGTKLSPFEQKTLANNIRAIANYVNVINERLKNISAKWNGISQNKHNDTLSYCMDVLHLHGHTDISAGYFLRPEFIEWLKCNTLGNAKYKNKHITCYMLETMGEYYNLFNVYYDREPNSYEELRDYVLQEDEKLKLKSTIEKVEK